MSASPETLVLTWPGRVLAEEDLRRQSAPFGEVVLSAKTLVTPLAHDWLKARKIAVRRAEVNAAAPSAKATWGVASDGPYPLVGAAVAASRSEGRVLADLPGPEGCLASWARKLTTDIYQGHVAGIVTFVREPGLVACIANKTSGVRAVTFADAREWAGLRAALGPNFLAIGPEGRSAFELGRMLAVATESAPALPASLLKFFDQGGSHPHR